MSEQWNSKGLLSGYRVLDLTDEKGLLCGRTLGDWGADVIKVERPGGDPARNIGPFYKDIPHPEKSLYWFYTNANKRGITLDIERADGCEVFKRLVRTADFVIESFEPGYMDSLGLGYPDLERVNPGIIMTSITPFGQTGPYAHLKATDMVLWALGGMMYLCGDPDRPPVQVSVPQAYFHGAAHAAVGSLVALYHRELSGQGQHVDVSIQQAANFPTMVADETWDLLKINLTRTGAFYPQTTASGSTLWVRLNWPCKDGHANTMIRGGTMGWQTSSRAIVQMMEREGMASHLKDYDWSKYNSAIITQEEQRHLEEPIARFFQTKTKRELLEEAVRAAIILAQVSNTKDLLESPQLAARGYWVKVEHPELDDSLVYPGAPVKASHAPWAIQRRAPLIGEHNEEVYQGELGLSNEQVAMLKARAVI